MAAPKPQVMDVRLGIGHNKAMFSFHLMFPMSVLVEDGYGARAFANVHDGGSDSWRLPRVPNVGRWQCAGEWRQPLFQALLRLRGHRQPGRAGHGG